MAFNTLQFFLFLPIVFLIYNFVSDRWRWFILLSSNLIFYIALKSPNLLLALALVTIGSYFWGICLDRAEPNKKKSFLITGIAFNIFILVIFKYLPFLATNLNHILTQFPNPHLLPIPVAIPSIGVSFYVFQAMSYLINIYLDITPAERNFGYFAVYQSFFPKLLQGPIERPEALLPQFRKKYFFDYENVRGGLLLAGWGLFKKLVLADRLAVVVNIVYGNLPGYNGFQLAFATLAFSFQIYFDFSGYTDIALGVARLFNIQLTDNFNRPYLARTIPDFWRRWHITFSRWILDYIFKPIQMELRNWGKWGTSIALLTTFLVSGIWHGANWTFIIWGLLHGFYMVISTLYTPLRKKIYKKLRLNKTAIAGFWQVILTFSLVNFAWIFFRADSLDDAGLVIVQVFNWVGSIIRFSGKWIILQPLMGQADFSHFITTLPTFFQLHLDQFPLQFTEWIVLVLGIILYILISNFGAKLHFNGKPVWFRWVIYYSLVAVLLFTVWRNIVIYTDLYTYPQFLYFKF